MSSDPQKKNSNEKSPDHDDKGDFFVPRETRPNASRMRRGRELAYGVKTLMILLSRDFESRARLALKSAVSVLVPEERLELS